jgi:hypothetical protein
MSLTRLQARTRVREILDDINEDTHSRWSNSQINDAIDVARSLTAKMLIRNKYHGLWASTTLTLTNGTATLPDNERIISVQIQTGQTYDNVTLGSHHTPKVLTQVSGTLKVTYIAKTAALTADGDTCTFAGIDVEDLVIDQFLAATASMLLKPTENEVNNPLLQQLGILEKSIVGAAAPEVRAVSSQRPATKNCIRYYYDINTAGLLEIYT